MGIEIYSKEKDNVIILDVRGIIDINAADFVETVGWHLNNNRKDILCDFHRVNMIDYAGMSVISIAYKNVLNHKGRMKFACVTANVRKMFEAVLLDRTFDIYPTVNLALNAFKEDTIIDKIKHMKLRRRFSRLSLDMPIVYRGQVADAQQHKGKLFDLSGTGAYIYGKKTFKLRSEIFMQMRLAGSGLLELEAKVMWLPDKVVQPQHYPGMGVQFSNIDEATQAKIVDYVEKNKSHRSAGNKPLL